MMVRLKWKFSILITFAFFYGVFCTQVFAQEIAKQASRLPLVSISLTDKAAYPEDVTVFDGNMYVSSIADGSVKEINLTTKEERVFIAPSIDEFNSAWGIKINPKTGQLIVVMNQMYDFNPEHAKSGVVRAYNLKSGKLEKTWSMPEKFVGNSIDFDNKGNIYIGDIGPNARIIKIDLRNDKVKTWAQDKQWKQGGFGLGGMVFNKKDGFYAAHAGKLWFVKMNDNSTASAAKEVVISGMIDKTGKNSVASDGMVWAGDNTIYFAENDAMLPGANGILHKIILEGEAVGSNSNVVTGLKDPSGVYFYNGNVYVAESQLGHIFKVDKGEPDQPFVIKVY